MPDWVVRQFMQHVTEWITGPLWEALQVQSISIFGGLMIICFLLQMVLGSKKWGRRALWVALGGLVFVVLTA